MADKEIYKMHADLCKVFTSPVRVEILDNLRSEKKSVTELVELTGLSQSNVSQHLQILRDKGVVRTEKNGKSVLYSLSNPKLVKAFGIMREILEDRLAETAKLHKKIVKTGGR